MMDHTGSAVQWSSSILARLKSHRAHASQQKVDTRSQRAVFRNEESEVKLHFGSLNVGYKKRVSKATFSIQHSAIQKSRANNYLTHIKLRSDAKFSHKGRGSELIDPIIVKNRKKLLAAYNEFSSSKKLLA